MLAQFTFMEVKMTPIIKEFNVETGVETLREMTATELKQYEVDKAKANLEREADAIRNAEKAALLEKLGITEDEARLLLG